MRLRNLTSYQRSRLIAQIKLNVSLNAHCNPKDVAVTIKPGEHGRPAELHYIDEDGEKAIEIGYKCDNCGAIYSAYEEPGELCQCPGCGRPTYENW